MLVAILLANLDGAVISGTFPTIVADLGGQRATAWLASSYLLGSAVTLLFWGTLGDTKGYQTVLVGGLAVMTVFTTLCGLTGLVWNGSYTVYEFALFRFLQGVGGGGVLTASYALSAMTQTARRRARNLSIFNMIFAALTLISPGVGGLVSDHASLRVAGVWLNGWRIIFLMQAPVLAWALFLATRVCVPAKQRPIRQFDRIAYALVVVLVFLFLSVLTALPGSRLEPGDTLPHVAVLIIGVLVCAATLARRERRCANPLIPRELRSDPRFRNALTAQFFSMAALLCASVAIPAVMRLALNTSAYEASVVMSAFAFGLGIGSFGFSRSIERVEERQSLVSGGICLALASLWVAYAFFPTSAVAITGSGFVLGLGFGPLQNSFLITIQELAPGHLLGQATAIAQMARRFGAFVGSFVGGECVAIMLRAKMAQAIEPRVWQAWVAAAPLVYIVPVSILLATVMLCSFRRLHGKEAVSEQGRAK